MNHQNVSVSLLPFTHPYPHGSIDVTLDIMREGLREGQVPHGWLFQGTS